MNRERLPTRRECDRIKVRIGSSKAYIDLGRYDDGRLAEIFITLHKEGSAFRSIMNDLAVVISLALQSGVTPQTIGDALKGSDFEPRGPTDDDRIPKCLSIIDYVAQLLLLEGGDDDLPLDP